MKKKQSPPEPPKKNGFKAPLQAFALVSQLGFTMAACIIVGFFIGRWLDNLLGTSPWLLLVFTIIGVGASFKAMFEYAKE